jgi:Tfp pilus assembly protein PilN
MALREVNLVPPDMLFRRQLGRHLSVWAACLLLCLSGIVGGYSLDSRLILAKKRSLMNLADVDTNLGARIRQINELQGELEKLHEKQTALRAITRNQPYSSVLLRLADIMNENTWLTDLAIDDTRESEDTTTVEFTGFSLSNDDLGGFLSRLAGTVVFQDVVLNFANETRDPRTKGKEGDQGKLIHFKVTCNLLRSMHPYGS